MSASDEIAINGDRLLVALEALANPHRLRILALLQKCGRAYISQMARDIGISRPLLHMHLKRLEKAGLVQGQLELSEDGKAHNWISTTDFNLELTPQSIAQAATSLSEKPKAK